MTTMPISECPDSVSIIIPAYNEEAAIGGVIEELQEFISGHPEITWEIIVVDDGSTDRTVSEVQKFEAVTLLKHPVNRGYGASLKTGIRAASGSYVLLMDADGQHISSEIPKLLEGSRDFDMVIGERPAGASPMSRRPGKFVLALLVRLLIGGKIPDINSGQRLIHRKTILKYIHVCSNKFSFSTSSTMALMSEGHFVRFVKVDVRARMTGVSQVGVSTALRMMLMIFRIVMVFHPLRIFLPIGSVFFILGMASMVNDIRFDNISDLSLMLVLLTSVTLLLGLVSDQIAHVRRELKSDT